MWSLLTRFPASVLPGVFARKDCSEVQEQIAEQTQLSRLTPQPHGDRAPSVGQPLSQALGRLPTQVYHLCFWRKTDLDSKLGSTTTVPEVLDELLVLSELGLSSSSYSSFTGWL